MPNRRGDFMKKKAKPAKAAKKTTKKKESNVCEFC